MTEYPELEKLKAANEVLREQGKEWLFTSLEKICAEINTELTPKLPEPATSPSEPALQIGTQDWQFAIGDSINKSLMIGERIGIRHKGKTLTVEVGWISSLLVIPHEEAGNTTDFLDLDEKPAEIGKAFRNSQEGHRADD